MNSDWLETHVRFQFVIPPRIDEKISFRVRRYILGLLTTNKAYRSELSEAGNRLAIAEA